MSTDLGGPGTRIARPVTTPLPSPPPASPPGPGTGQAPRAQRSRPPGWRDPRLWVGVALVAGSVVAGSRVLAAADDTVLVWAADGDLAAGEALGPEDLVAERLRFDDPGELDRYFTAADQLPSGQVLTRPVGAGELVPRAALGAPDDGSTVEVPVAVDPEQVPGSVTDGSVVDVYVLSSAPVATGAPARRSASPALAAVRVVDAPDPAQTLGASGRRQLVLAVPEEDAGRFFGLLGSLETPVVTVVRRG